MLLLTIAAPADESARLEAVTRELLQPLEVRLEVRRVSSIDLAEMRRAPARPLFARVWIALFGGRSARLYLEHGASDRLLVRDVPGDADNPELVREELGHILQAAVEGLKAGAEIGEPRQEALQQVAPKAPPSTAAPSAVSKVVAPRRPVSWRFGARYEVRWSGDGAHFEDGPGIVMALATRLGFEASGYYRRPRRVERQPVGARFEAVSLRALVTFEPLTGFRLGAGLGGDFVHVTPLASDRQSLHIVEPAWRRLAMGRLQATYGHRAGHWMELQISIGADADASGTRYVLERSADEVTVLQPSPLRPFVSLGACFP